MPETSIALCQNALMEQSVVLGNSHVPPPAYLTHLGYNDARLNLSEVVHQTFLGGCGCVRGWRRVPLSAEKWKSSCQTRDKSMWTSREPPALLSTSWLKSTSFSGNTPGLLSTVNSPVPQDLGSVWLRTKMGYRLSAYCGGCDIYGRWEL